MTSALTLIVARILLSPVCAATGENLLALNAVPAAMGPAELGRFFDASRRGMPVPEVSFEISAHAPVAVSAPLPIRRAPAKVPFVVEIPDTPPAPYARTFRRLLRTPQTDNYDALIRSQAAQRGLDERLVKSIVAAESEFVPRARSHAGAIGLMQVMPATAEYVGVSRTVLGDAVENIRAGTAYLAYLFSRAWKRYHMKGVAYAQAPQWLIQRVIAAYNAGPRFLAHRRLYAQTREYVRKVLMYYRSAVTDLRGRPNW